MADEGHVSDELWEATRTVPTNAPGYRPRLRRVTAVNDQAHVRVGERWQPGALWVALAALPCAGCGRPLRRGELAVRGVGLPNARSHDPLCVAVCRPFHLRAEAAAALEPGTVLPPGTAVGDDPRCECCRAELRREEAERWLAAHGRGGRPEQSRGRMTA